MQTPPPSITRREMLKVATVALIASAAKVPAAQPAKKRVIVIGGGIGGLSCAYDLVERGHDVTVLEASRRTGGHVKTIYDLASEDPLLGGRHGAEHQSRHRQPPHGPRL